MWKVLHSDNIKGINAVNHASLLCIIDEALKRYMNPHHVHIGSLFTYSYLNYVFNGKMTVLFAFAKYMLQVNDCIWLQAGNDGSSSDTDIDEAVEEYRDALRVATLQACGIPESPSNPTEITSHRASLAAFSYLIWTIFISAIICHGQQQVYLSYLFVQKVSILYHGVYTKIYNT